MISSYYLILLKTGALSSKTDQADLDVKVDNKASRLLAEKAP
jgi:hypothetical protein